MIKLTVEAGVEDVCLKMLKDLSYNVAHDPVSEDGIAEERKSCWQVKG